MAVKLAPSILSAAFERLGEEVRAVEAGGADQIHVDVMDGHFVPNLSMGPIVVEALRRVTRLPLDVHLMIAEPARYVEPFIKAGASHITFHVEVVDDQLPLARLLRARGIGAGISLNPATGVDRVLELIPELDLVLVMTVNPGFGGQAFLGENLDKVRALRRAESSAARPHPLDIQVDGGIDERTAPLARAAGANVFVAGSAIFRSPDPRAALRALRARVEAVPAAG